MSNSTLCRQIRSSLLFTFCYDRSELLLRAFGHSNDCNDRTVENNDEKRFETQLTSFSPEGRTVSAVRTRDSSTFPGSLILRVKAWSGTDPIALKDEPGRYRRQLTVLTRCGEAQIAMDWCLVRQATFRENRLAAHQLHVGRVSSTARTEVQMFGANERTALGSQGRGRNSAKSLEAWGGVSPCSFAQCQRDGQTCSEQRQHPVKPCMSHFHWTCPAKVRPPTTRNTV